MQAETVRAHLSEILRPPNCGRVFFRYTVAKTNRREQ